MLMFKHVLRLRLYVLAANAHDVANIKISISKNVCKVSIICFDA